MKLTKKIRHGLIATVLTISPLSTVLAVLTANVGYIDGHVQRYNGVATATVLTESYTTLINYSSSKRALKKGQKIKVNLAVIPYANDGF
ncbi:hypothetical protein [Lactobacillus sp. B4026]|uniref:hypothetical protein n=1 Tax=Lactobacillus sp. B4026 TaxID=2818035 RepID=UPI00226B7183|nr:hypothetical protein [Lactobacillus sp. B4026]MCX8736388.1 hypothetical protein [Lactobacillus sp. B4026]